MCRNIKPLFNFEPPATKNEVHEAALQFVRKVSGFNKPSQVNEAAFHEAVEDIEKTVRKMLKKLEDKRAGQGPGSRGGKAPRAEQAPLPERAPA